MKQKTKMSSLINIITVILVVGAVAWGVVKILSQRTQTNSDTPRQVDDGESGPVAAGPEAKATDALGEEKLAATENVEEAEAEAETEVEAETEADTPAQDQTDKPAQDESPAETAEQPQRPPQRFDMRQMWANLNLTDAEQARLAQGFELVRQKWQNMSEEERQAETARLRTMRARWEAMPEDEQREAMQRMRGRFEDWRQSGGIELPDLSLD